MPLLQALMLPHSSRFLLVHGHSRKLEVIGSYATRSEAAFAGAELPELPWPWCWGIYDTEASQLVGMPY